MSTFRNVRLEREQLVALVAAQLAASTDSHCLITETVVQQAAEIVWKSAEAARELESREREVISSIFARDAIKTAPVVQACGNPSCRTCQIHYYCVLCRIPFDSWETDSDFVANPVCDKCTTKRGDTGPGKREQS